MMKTMNLSIMALSVTLLAGCQASNANIAKLHEGAGFSWN